MTEREQSEKNRRIEEWDRARLTVDEYVGNFFPFNADQIIEFMELESKVFGAAIKLCKFSQDLH